MLADLPTLKHVILVGGSDGGTESDAMIKAASPDYEIPPTDPQELSTLHFTSGTTGSEGGDARARGGGRAPGLGTLRSRSAARLHLLVHGRSRLGHRDILRHHRPLDSRLHQLSDEEEFDAERWYKILAEQKVNVWYTAPTAIRMLMKAGARSRQGLRPVKPALYRQRRRAAQSGSRGLGEQALGLPIHDNWWQTETGGIMIANFAAMDIRPGSMGKPLPGIEAAVVRHNDGRRRGGQRAGCRGRVRVAAWLAVDVPRLPPRGARYQKCFSDGWYLTGDLAESDADGYFWFVGRADDVIKSSGHLIGPFEVESALMEHPAVAEAGVDRQARPDRSARW